MPVLFYFWRCCVISNREHQINEEIRDKELRVIDVDGNQLGILSADEALKIAFEKDLDLVKIAPQATPPVCRIMDYGKFCFEQTKRAKEAKKNQKVIEIKEVRMSSTIDTHDFNVKVNQAVKFLNGGDKIKVSVRFKKRTLAHPQFGEELLAKFKVEKLTCVLLVSRCVACCEHKSQGVCTILVDDNKWVDTVAERF